MAADSEAESGGVGYREGAMDQWLWIDGYGLMAMDRWLWIDGYGSMAINRWL